MKKFLSGLGWDGWTFLICGIAAIFIVSLDFLSPAINISTETAIKLVIAVSGMLLAGVAAQTGRRSADIKDLRDAIGLSTIELVGEGDEFQLHVQQAVSKAKKFVLDTTLNAERAKIWHPADNPSHYYYTVYKRLQNNEITYRRVEVIFGKERLESTIARLLIYEGTDYYIRYYDAPPKAIPVLNLLSIDNEWFYLGGFYSTEAPADIINLAYIRDQKIGSLLDAYWSNLWFHGKPLNEGKRINWDEIKFIARRVEMSEEELSTIVNKWKDEIQRRKRRNR